MRWIAPPSPATRRPTRWTLPTWSEALRELELDEMEGADIVMVKPALAYLDVIRAVKEHTVLPVAAYNVVESTRSSKRALQRPRCNVIRRAGADIILTYFALVLV